MTVTITDPLALLVTFAAGILIGFVLGALGALYNQLREAQGDV